MAGRPIGKCLCCGEVRKFEAPGLCHRCYSDEGIRADHDTLRPGEMQAMAIKEKDGSTFEREVRRRLLKEFSYWNTAVTLNDKAHANASRCYITGVRDASQGSVRELAKELLEAAGEPSKEA